MQLVNGWVTFRTEHIKLNQIITWEHTIIGNAGEEWLRISMISGKEIRVKTDYKEVIEFRKALEEV